MIYGLPPTGFLRDIIFFSRKLRNLELNFRYEGIVVIITALIACVVNVIGLTALIRSLSLSLLSHLLKWSFFIFSLSFFNNFLDKLLQLGPPTKPAIIE